MWGDMRVLIVDEEPVARSTLAEVLATRNDIEAFDSADNVTEALDKLGIRPSSSEDFMKPLGLTVNRLALELHVPATRILRNMSRQECYSQDIERSQVRRTLSGEYGENSGDPMHF
jgi:CheY-like chemotaxis protein